MLHIFCRRIRRRRYRVLRQLTAGQREPSFRVYMYRSTFQNGARRWEKSFLVQWESVLYRAPVPRLAPGYTVYRRPRMAEEGVPENAEAV